MILVRTNALRKIHSAKQMELLNCIVSTCLTFIFKNTSFLLEKFAENTLFDVMHKTIIIITSAVSRESIMSNENIKTNFIMYRNEHPKTMKYPKVVRLSSL